MINIYVNGQSCEVQEGCSILDLLNLRNLEQTKVVVEKNEIVIQSKDFSNEYLGDGDRLEILQFVGGG